MKYTEKSFSSRPASDAYRENFAATFGGESSGEEIWEHTRIGPSQYRWLLKKAEAKAKPKKGKRGKR